MFRSKHNSTRLFVVAFAALIVFGTSNQVLHAQTFTSFDAPGAAQGTFPIAINRSGLIVGYFVDAGGVQHGFIRDPNGTFTIVDVPGSTGTRVTAVNSKGLVVGYSYSPSDTGFLRYRNGSFGTLNVPGGRYVEPVAMNDVGQIAGTAVQFFGASRGFIWSPGHTVTFTVPDAGYWVGVMALNSSGTIAGAYQDVFKQETRHGFLRDNAGNVTSFDAEGSTFTSPAAINASGQVAGAYVVANVGVFSFFRDTDGTMTLFTVAGGEAQATSINDAGVIVGTASGDTYESAFERDAAGNVNLIVLPFSNLASTAVGINLSGRIVGTYYDASYEAHGWLMTP